MCSKVARKLNGCYRDAPLRVYALAGMQWFGAIVREEIGSTLQG